jgi:hypothetical protein
MRTLTALICCSLLLAACEQLGIEDPAKVAAAAAAAKEAEGKAVGSACRQTGRVLEDCYALNPKAQKSAVFAGWRDMDGYMRENKIENAVPVVVARPATEAKPAAGGDKPADKAAIKPAEKPADKATFKPADKATFQPAAKPVKP